MRKSFRPQSDEETMLADYTGFVWDPEWYHVSFFNIPMISQVQQLQPSQYIKII